MPDANLFFIIAMSGVIGALAAMAVLLGIGTYIVRRLRLPNDPPFDVYFSSAAPALVKTPDKALAMQQAAAQHLHQQTLNKARYLCINALKCRDAYAALESLTEKNDAEKQALKKLKPIYKQLKDIPEAIEAWFKESGLIEHQNDIDKWHDKHQQHCADWQAIIDALPPPDRKRILLLLCALIASVGMLALANVLAGL